MRPGIVYRDCILSLPYSEFTKCNSANLTTYEIVDFRSDGAFVDFCSPLWHIHIKAHFHLININ